MWIHLNFGDNGLKALFLKVHRQLTLGGFFFLEVPLWQEYRQKRTLSPKLKENCKGLKLRPQHWRDYLEEVLGFKCVKVICEPGKLKRAILLLQK